MKTSEIQKVAALEDGHWWYRERRILLAKEARRLGRPGRALDIGSAGGGNTRVLRELGWDAVAADVSEEAVELAQRRGLKAVHADARRLPFPPDGFDLVVAFDILEHIDEDHLAAAEIARVLRPGGTALIAVPCDMALWSEHDVALGHVRRYTRQSLEELVDKSGLTIERVRSWNVLLRPVVAWRRRKSTGSDLEELHPVVNLGLRAIISAERCLPLGALPGVSLLLRARRPEVAAG